MRLFSTIFRTFYVQQESTISVDPGTNNVDDDDKDKVLHTFLNPLVCVSGIGDLGQESEISYLPSIYITICHLISTVLTCNTLGSIWHLFIF